MEYTIKELADLAGVSARTLRYYDEICLLQPARVNASGYRFYGQKEVDLLWQILFYKERGMDLGQIRKILYEEDFDVVSALEGHLLELEQEKRRMEDLIENVKKTVRAMKGEIKMSDREKFEAFKERVVRENEEAYGKEIREKYGDEEMDEANKKVLNMSKEDYERFQNLGAEIRKRLEEVVRAGKDPAGEEGRRIVLLHKEWLGMTWKSYTSAAHKAMADMYIGDERFQLYYDREVKGCAKFLEEAIRFWVERI